MCQSLYWAWWAKYTVCHRSHSVMWSIVIDPWSHVYIYRPWSLPRILKICIRRDLKPGLGASCSQECAHQSKVKNERISAGNGVVGRDWVGSIQRGKNIMSQSFQDWRGLDVDTEVKVPREQRCRRERRQEQVTLGLLGHLKGNGNARKGWSLTVTQSMDILNSTLAATWKNKKENGGDHCRGPGKWGWQPVP